MTMRGRRPGAGAGLLSSRGTAGSVTSRARDSPVLLEQDVRPAISQL